MSAFERFHDPLTAFRDIDHDSMWNRVARILHHDALYVSILLLWYC